MLLLAIDTANHLCAVTLYDSVKQVFLAERSEDIGRGHAEILMGQIETCLKEAGKTYSDISRIGATRGPGNFTGVRVGLSVARGLALSLEIDAVGVSTLDACEAVAQDKHATGKILTVIDARRDDAFYKFSGQRPCLGGYPAIAAELNDNVTAICGSGSRRLVETVNANLPILHELSAVPINVVARLAAAADPTQSPAEPLYLRSADAKPQHGFALNKA